MLLFAVLFFAIPAFSKCCCSDNYLNFCRDDADEPTEDSPLGGSFREAFNEVCSDSEGHRDAICTLEMSTEGKVWVCGDLQCGLNVHRRRK